MRLEPTVTFANYAWEAKLRRQRRSLESSQRRITPLKLGLSRQSHRPRNSQYVNFGEVITKTGRYERLVVAEKRQLDLALSCVAQTLTLIQRPTVVSVFLRMSIAYLMRAQSFHRSYAMSVLAATLR